MLSRRSSDALTRTGNYQEPHDTILSRYLGADTIFIVILTILYVLRFDTVMLLWFDVPKILLTIKCIWKVFRSLDFCPILNTYLHTYLDPLLWYSKLSSGASCFHWSSLRFFYNLIGVHLWYIQLIGDDLERHTPAYIRSHRWQCISEQKPSHEFEGIVHRAPRQDCVEAQIRGGVPKNVCRIEGLQEHSGLHHS